MRVAAVVLHFRHWPGISATLRALAAQDLAPVRTIVVDNASGDGSADEIRSAFPALRVVEAARNAGYGPGMNLGVRAAGLDDVDAVLLLTHECVLDPGALAALAARLEAAPGVGAVGPLLRLASRPEAVYSSGGWIDRRWIVGHHEYDPGQPVERDWLDGAALLVRASAWRATGGFDNRFFLYYEEVDFLLRLRTAGWGVECVPGATATQESGVMGPFLFARNRLAVVRRHAGFPTYAKELVRTAAWFAVKAPRGERVAGLAGLAASALGHTGPPPERFRAR